MRVYRVAPTLKSSPQNSLALIYMLLLVIDFEFEQFRIVQLSNLSNLHLVHYCYYHCSRFLFPPSSRCHSTPYVLETGLLDEPISVPWGRSAVIEGVEGQGPWTWLSGIVDRTALLVREIQIDHDYCHALETRWDKMRWKWRLRAKVIPINQNMIESTRQLNQSPYLLCNITPYLI